MIGHKQDKIGPSCLLSEHGDLSLLLYFSKQRFVGKLQGKFKKKLSGNSFISEESYQNKDYLPNNSNHSAVVRNSQGCKKLPKNEIQTIHRMDGSSKLYCTSCLDSRRTLEKSVSNQLFSLEFSKRLEN